MTLRISKTQFVLGAFAWESLFLFLVGTHIPLLFFPTVVIGFLTLVLLPGLLTLIILRIRTEEIWSFVSLSVGFSVLELMIMGLVGNTLLPFVGVTRPLDMVPLLLEFACLVGVLIAVGWARIESIVIPIQRWGIFSTSRDTVIALFPALFVALAVLGALRLNNGYDGSIVLCMLVCIAAYSVFLFRKAETLDPTVIPTALFFIALALLLMTSLRGWYITGHDIQREFSVFQLTKDSGLWNIAAYRDAYNACISITILPTIFANVLALADPYVYKVLFQVLFALVTTSVFLLIRRYFLAPLAFVSTLYFVSFPAFFTDMSFLNRQEIAFFFLSLMFLICLDDRLAYQIRRWLFVLFGIGMILSHYSTTYTVIALFLFLIIARPIMKIIGPVMPRWLNQTTAASLMTEVRQQSSSITWWAVALLLAASFFWSSIVTDTSSNSLYRVIAHTIEAMQSTLKEDTRSSDVLYSLFSWKQVDLPQLFDEYKNRALEQVAEAPEGVYYGSAVTTRYPVSVVQQELMSPTVVGRMLVSAGLNLQEFNFAIKQFSAKLLQLFMLIGVLVALYKREWFYRVPHSEYVLMGIGSLIILFAIIVLPVLSVEYGLFRAFQQSLIFLAPFIVIGSASLFFFLQERWRTVLAGTLAIVFFLSSTGVFTQLLGGYDAQLHLNNSGGYYDRFYVHESELQAIEWLAGEANKNIQKGIEVTIQGDHYALQAAPSLQKAHVITDIYPPLVRTDAYVFLSVANVTNGQANASYNQTAIGYTYPIEFLELTKSLVYDNGEVKIYR